jgi:hypothetical protein
VVGAAPVEAVADRVVLATGFDAAIERMELPCAPCGFPLVDRALRWAPGIYVTGPLAEL